MKHHRRLHPEAGPRLDADGGHRRLRRWWRRTRIGISQFPDVDFPTINVSVTWEGAAPEVDRERRRRAARGGAGPGRGRAQRITSTSRQGGASITVELDLVARRRPRAAGRADQGRAGAAPPAARHRPAGRSPRPTPRTSRSCGSACPGPFPQQVLADYARYRVKEKLQTVPGVGEVTLGGYLERNVRIWVDADAAGRARADRRRRASRALAARARRAARPAASRPRAARSTCACSARRSTSTTLRQHRGRASSDGAPVYLEDVALVEDGFEDVRRHRARQRRARAGPGHPQAARRQRGGGGAGRARRRSTRSSKTLPEGMELGINFDSTQLHRGVGPRDRARAAAGGAAHRARVLAVPRLAARARSTWCSRSRCRCSGTVAVIYFLGFTLNTFTLLGAGAGGRHRRRRRDHGAGEHLPPRRERARTACAPRARAPHEITFAALAATLAVIAIFLPVVFMKGVDRQVLLPVRRHALRRGAALVRRGDHAGAGALRAAPRRRRARAAAGSAAAVDRGFERLARALRAGCSRAALRRPLRGAGWRRRCCSSASIVAFRDAAERVRAVAGPEPAHGPPADRGRLRPRRRPTGCSSRPRRSSTRSPEVERVVRRGRRLRRRAA